MFRSGGQMLTTSAKIRPCTGLSIARTAVVILLMMTHCNGQHSENTWTFRKPGESYLAFTPEMSDSQKQHYSLSFRTKQANGVLLQHKILDSDAKGLSILTDYQLILELRQGKLKAGFSVDNFPNELTLGKALNNDRWHSVDLYIDPAKAEMRLTLNGEIARESIRGYSWGNAQAVLTWSHLMTQVSIGDVRPRTAGHGAPFVGCISDIYYDLPDGTPRSPAYNVTKSVDVGCVDLCHGDWSCNLGKCVNNYVGVACDCYGTDFEGPYCEIEASTTVTFRGYEYVAYQLYKDGRRFMDSTRVSLEFKTEGGSGVLLYAVGSTPYHNHITVSIYSGSIHVSISFESEDLTFAEGIGLDDGRWHNLTIEHRERNVTFYLDGKATEKKVLKDYFLSLDPYIFIGGGNNFVETKGLPVIQSFVGCLRNVYIDDVSLLYELSKGNPRCTYNGGSGPSYECEKVSEVPISFPRSSSMLKWDINQMGQNLSVEFKIRTYHNTAILVSVELVSRREIGLSNTYGRLELWIVNKQPVLQFLPSDRNPATHENITLPLIVSDGLMHEVQLFLANSKVKVQVDGNAAETSRYSRVLEHRGIVILGYSLRKIDKQYGFVGCMLRIKIQGERLDPIALIKSESAVGLLLDGCLLVDHCSKNNYCEHKSICLSDWDGTHCICPGNHYEGKACHFSRYASSCDDYYSMGHVLNGFYPIDVDGAGPLTHAYVQCEMDMNGAVTVVEHNFMPNTTVRAAWMPDSRYELKYRDMSREQLTALTSNSDKCQQYLEYVCTNSPIRLSTKTWFKSTSGEIVDYIGSSSSGYCEGKDCKCDSNGKKRFVDKGYNKEPKQLPIMEMTFIQNSEGNALMTLGPLQCWGSKLQPSRSSITILNKDSYLSLHPWKIGDLMINFKTHKTKCLLLYQSNKFEAKDGDNYNYYQDDNIFYIKIISENSVKFSIQIGQHKIEETLRAPRNLDQGDWHRLSVEHDEFNIRFTLDTARTIISLPKGLTNIANYSGILYLGGAAKEILEDFRDDEEFTGCFYGLVYNGEAKDLTKLLDGSMGGMSSGCMSSCWPNPCLNGGVCEENWTKYRCMCTDPWAHIGDNCREDLNLDAVTFSGLMEAQLFFNVSDSPEVLYGTLVLSFRTHRSEQLLFYAYDYMGNFVQLEITDSHTITFTFNNFYQIIKESVSTTEVLNNDQWIQVVAENYSNFTRLIVLRHSKVIEVPRGRIAHYSPNPFFGVQPEPTVFMQRPTKEPPPFIYAYIGGVPGKNSYASRLTGCVRGVRAGNYAFRLQKAAKALNNDTLVAPLCISGCEENTCLNKGFCIEKWKNKSFECDCSDNGFTGFHCEKEPSISFNGNTVVRQELKLGPNEDISVTETLSLRFKADTIPDGQKVVLVYITSSDYKDYILITLNVNSASKNVILETNQGYGKYRITAGFTVGRSHDLIYIRRRDQMNLQVLPLDTFGSVIVDEKVETSQNYPDFPLNNLNAIYIGGYIPDNLNLIGFSNFSGCISNFTFVPSMNGLPRHSLRDYHLNHTDIELIGEQRESCNTSKILEATTTAPKPTVKVTLGLFREVTMPPWHNSQIKVVPLSAVPTQVIPSVTSHSSTTIGRTVGNQTYPIVANADTEPVDDLTIIVVVSLIAGILIISLCAALILVRKKKHRGDYLVKSDGDNDMELKQPLNHSSPYNTPSPFKSYTMPRSFNSRPHSNSDVNSRVPADHLAKLDEFSMITAILGPRAAKADTLPPDLSRKRYSQGNYPLMDDEKEYISPIYNARKQRPASSISEVLEELERRQHPMLNGSPDDLMRCHGEGDLEWDPQADTTTPIRNEEILFFNSPLLPPIPDELEDSRVSSFSGHPSSLGADSYQKTDTLEGSNSPPWSTHMASGAECNGDSGYEAESRPEVTEDDITPETLGDDDHHQKLFSFHVPDLHPDSSPNMSEISARERLLRDGTAV